MRKYILSISVVVGILTGCATQPQIENLDTNQTQEVNQTQESNVTKDTTTLKEEVQADTSMADENISVENSEVVEQTIETEEIAKETMQNPDFVRNVSSIVVYFDFDKYNIKPSEWPKVEKLAKLLKENNSNYTIRIEGNCDEWGTEEYNYALGLKRANSVKQALIKLGVDPKKLTVISYGELNPVCTAHARWCWRKNRRDNFTYLP